MATDFSTRILALLVAASTAACGNVAVDGERDVDPPSPENLGNVSLSQTPPGATANSNQPSSLSAAFLKDRVNGCVLVEQEGDCGRIHCDGAWVIPGAAVDAGTLTVTGGLMDITADATSYKQSFQTPLFEPGDVIEFALGGNADFAPASVSLVAPPLPVVAPPAPGPMVRSAPLTLTWESEPGAGRVVASITAYPEAWQDGPEILSGDVNDRVVCEAGISAGSITLPVSLLSKLPPSTILDADLQVSVISREVRERDDFRLDFSVGGYATLAGGGMYWFSKPLQ